VRLAWESALAVAPPGDLVCEDVALCVSWARRHLARLPGTDARERAELVELLQSAREQLGLTGTS
jgi:hypothetical protein